MAYPLLKAVAPQSVSVGTDVLRVMGSTSWTGVGDHQQQRVDFRVTNEGTTGQLVYVRLVRYDLSLTGAVSSTLYDKVLVNGQNETWEVPWFSDLVIVASGTCAVNAQYNVVVC